MRRGSTCFRSSLAFADRQGAEIRTDDYKKRNPSTSPYDIITSKHFMQACVRDWKKEDKKFSVYTAMQR
jgi:hypothetical protein